MDPLRRQPSSQLAFLTRSNPPCGTRWSATSGRTSPSFLLLIGALPFWDALRHRAGVQSALKGVNATVVGILIGALYTPVWTSAIFTPADFGIGVLAFLLLVFWQTPPWLVVVLGAEGAAAIAAVSELDRQVAASAH